ncbi:hypothetical protein DL769_006620 [Monosporascus sp. CRB-8-3]|nr:hypothetical protein DL769_006620 [Monosporascus sp. CRB-8-3]
MSSTALYHPLTADSFRLFRLHHGTSNTLCGSLVKVPLGTAPPYFALSYCWGTEDQDIPIQVSGQVLHVSPGLVDAIRRLRELGTADDDSLPAIASSLSGIRVEYVWIDRICINQDDIAERCSQVRAMGIIYSQAVRVLIWLGPDLDSCSDAWQLVDQIYDVFKRENPAAKYLADIPLNVYSDTRHAASGLPAWDHELWQHLARVLELPWFTRVWIIQEVVLSRRDPVILHGQRHGYPWHRLGWAASWLRRNGYLRLAQVPNRMQSVDTIANIRRSSGRWRLGALLVATSIKFRAADQRDKVYGLLGMAAESQSAGGGTGVRLPEALRPDYALNVQQVYTRVASFLLAECKNLSVLTRAGGVGGDVLRTQRKHSIECLPSWVPNWCDFATVERDVAKSLSWLEIPSTADGDAVAMLGFPEQYRASAGLEAKVQSSPDPSAARISGLVADSVIAVMQFHNGPASAATDGGSFASQLLRTWEMAVPFLPEGEARDWIRSYVKATTADQYQLWGRTAKQLLRDGAAFLLERLSSGECRMASGTVSQMIVDLLNEMATGGDPESYAALARNFCLSRAFVVTANRRLGIGPAGTREGDEIAVMFGGGVPYVLRKREGDVGYLFVGESYIHGLMNGEAIGAWKRGELAEEVLELR